MTLAFAAWSVLRLGAWRTSAASAYGSRKAGKIAHETPPEAKPRPGDWLVGDLLLPPGAAKTFLDPITLWRRVDARASGQLKTVGSGLVLALPREDELSAEECLDMVRSFAQRFIADRLPVQIDLHKVPDTEVSIGHRHAHLVIGAYPIDGDRIVRRLARQWLPVYRRHFVDAPDWSRLWGACQAAFYRSRDIALGVPPASGIPERTRDDAGPSRAIADLARVQVEVDEEINDTRWRRRERLADPRLLLQVMTRDTLAFRGCDVIALARSLHPRDVVIRELMIEQASDSADLLALKDEDAPFVARFLTTRQALERLRLTIERVGGLEADAVAVSTIPEMRTEAERMLAATAGRPNVVAIWGDSWTRVSLDIRTTPRGPRHISARQLSEMDDSPALQIKPGSTVLVFGVERMRDRQVELLVEQVVDSGATLRLLAGPRSPGFEDGLWRIVTEEVAGEQIPPGQEQARSIMICRNRLDHLLEAIPTPFVPIAERAKPCLVAMDPEVHDGSAQGAPHAPTRMTPREALASCRETIAIDLHQPSDWLWAVTLIERWPNARLSIFGISAAEFIAAVSSQHRAIAAALVGRLYEREDDPTDRHPIDVAVGTDDDLDLEAAADQALDALDPDHHDDVFDWDPDDDREEVDELDVDPDESGPGNP